MPHVVRIERIQDEIRGVASQGWTPDGGFVQFANTQG